MFKDKNMIPDDVIAYRCLFEECKDVQKSNSEVCRKLPNVLVIEPGDYLVFNKAYSMNEEGLYRFILPFKKCEQRIVHSGG